jgi:hypothetical protein
MSGYWEALYDFEQTSYPTALLFPTLPYYLSLLPAIFRLFAFLTILPVLLLAGGDLFGWTVFKFVLRPLGYASTYVKSLLFNSNHHQTNSSLFFSTTLFGRLIPLFPPCSPVQSSITRLLLSSYHELPTEFDSKIQNHHPI